MNTWKSVLLDEVAFFQEGPGVRKWQFRDEGIKLVNVRNIVNEELFLKNTNRYLSEDEVQTKYQHFLVDEGDLIMASSGVTWGKTAWVESKHLPLCMNTSMIRFKSKDNNILDKYFLCWFLKSNLFISQMRRLITGSAQPNFGPSHLKQISIPLPLLKEQKRIAATLGKADAIRRKRQKAIDLINQLLHSFFLDMFGDPVANPKGWEIKKLKNISTKILSGSTPKGGSKVYVEEGILFLRSQNVWKNNLVLDDIAYIDKATHSKMSKSSLKKNDLLITKTGRINTENSSLGRAAIYLGEYDGANINGHVYLIRLQDDVLNEFVLHILTTNEYRDYIRGVCVGGIDKRQINKEHLEQFPIIYPPVDMQQQFAELIQAVEAQKKQAKESLKKSEELFSSLNQKAFHGELRKQTKAA